jgi:hypothetical protein
MITGVGLQEAAAPGVGDHPRQRRRVVVRGEPRVQVDRLPARAVEEADQLVRAGAAEQLALLLDRDEQGQPAVQIRLRGCQHPHTLVAGGNA